MRSQKKDRHLKAVNEARLAQLEPTQTIVKLCQWEDVEAQADEMWSFVHSKQQQRWLWHAIDHDTGEVWADVLSNHQDTAFLELKSWLEPFGIMQFYTDGWGAYERHLDPALPTARKTMCFSKSIWLHDVVTGLFINRYEFGVLV